MIYGSASVTTTVKANQNFLALMALGQNNDKKPTTMERMALLSLLTQKQSKTDMAIFTMLPAGFGQASFSTGTTSSYTASASSIDLSPNMGTNIDIEV